MDYRSVAVALLLLALACVALPGLIALAVLWLRERSRAAMLTLSAQAAGLQVWLGEVGGYEYASELDVEAKFVYPALRHLGFRANDCRMRVAVEVQVGRQAVRGIADWVVYDGSRPWVVVEAKAPSESLEPAHAQARSYAVALKAPLIMLVNGKRAQVWRRGLDTDSLLFDCKVDQLPAHWAELVIVLGK